MEFLLLPSPVKNILAENRYGASASVGEWEGIQVEGVKIESHDTMELKHSLPRWRPGWMNEITKAFLGWDYSGDFPFTHRMTHTVGDYLRKRSIEPLYPLGRHAGGDLLRRICLLIDSADVGFFDCTTMNGNVVFEYAYCRGRNVPGVLLYQSNFQSSVSLPQQMKAEWGIWYDRNKKLLKEVDAVLNRPPMTTCDSVQLDTHSALVISSGEGMSSQFSCQAAQCLEHLHLRVSVATLGDTPSLSTLFTLVSKTGVVVVLLEPGSNEDEKRRNAGLMLPAGYAHALDRELHVLQFSPKKVFSDLVGMVHGFGDAESVATTLNQAYKVAKVTRSGRWRGTPETQIPQFGALVVRPRVLDRVREVLSKTGRLLITAPAGFGKTAVLVESVKQLGMPVVWYTFSEESGQLSHVLEAVIFELQKVCPSAGIETLRLLREGRVPPVQFANTFVEELSGIRGALCLVFDDAHSADPESAKFIERVMVGAPKGVTVIVSSRGRLGFDTERFRLSGRVGRLSAEDLIVTEEELPTFFGDWRLLSENEATLLYRWSGGWVAGLALLKSFPPGDLDELMKRAETANFFSYFAQEVMERLPPGDQEFLLQLSILRRITLEEAKFLSGEPNPRKKLMDLFGRNSFLSLREGDPVVFELHPLFRTFLRERYAEIHGASVRAAAYSSLAKWCAAQRQWLDAVVYGLEGGDFPVVGEALETAAPVLIELGHADQVLAWIRRMPHEDLCRRPDLLRYAAWASMEASELNQASAFLTQCRSRAEVLDTKALAELLLFEGQLMLLRGEPESTAIAKFEEASSLTGQAGPWSTYFSAELQALRLRVQAFITLRDQSGPEQLLDRVEAVLKRVDQVEARNASSWRAEGLTCKAIITHALSVRQFMDSRFALDVREALGQPMPLRDRAAAAKELLRRIEEESKLWSNAIQLCEPETKLWANTMVEYVFFSISWLRMFSWYFGPPEADRVTTHLGRLQAALEVYRKLGDTYSVANCYNEAAQLYNLLDDKARQREMALLSEKIARQHGFDGLAEKARNNADIPTLSESRTEAVIRTQDGPRGLSDSELERCAEEMTKALGFGTATDRDRRKAILKRELQESTRGEELSESWCIHMEVLYQQRFPNNDHSSQYHSKVVECHHLGIRDAKSFSVEESVGRFKALHCLGCVHRKLPG